MANRYQGGILGVGFNPLRAPNAPTIGTATSPTATTASVAFTAPANVGGSAITSYAVQSTPGGIGASGASSPITVSGLTTGTAYTFRVTALNSYGPSPASASSNSVTPAVPAGQQAYTTAGTYSWVAPAGVTSVSVVAVGPGGWGAGNSNDVTGGAGGGGGLGYTNNISVTPGNSYTVRVGEGFWGAGGTSSYFQSTAVVNGGAGNGAEFGCLTGGAGGTYVGTGGGNGGNGGSSAGYPSGGGGGGAGGYAGTGGTGGTSTTPFPSAGTNGTAGSGGGGGGGAFDNGNTTANGGGVGLLGQGANGAGGSGGGAAGSPGSGGSGKTYGGGANGGSSSVNGGGAVRIIWPGTTRSFPSTNTGNL